jgi:hypothetical protein
MIEIDYNNTEFSYNSSFIIDETTQANEIKLLSVLTYINSSHQNNLTTDNNYINSNLNEMETFTKEYPKKKGFDPSKNVPLNTTPFLFSNGNFY